MNNLFDIRFIELPVSNKAATRTELNFTGKYKNFDEVCCSKSEFWSLVLSDEFEEKLLLAKLHVIFCAFLDLERLRFLALALNVLPRDRACRPSGEPGFPVR